jgi:hypothetical protein
MAASAAVYLEVGAKRIFAGAVEWPGWCRSARNEDEALAALLAYATRYAAAVAGSGGDFKPTARLTVAESFMGGAGTDFGVSSIAPAADDRPLTPAELGRQSRLLEAAWDAFDRAWRRAHQARAELRKGPRGGGRDLTAIREHVLGAEEGYLAKLGSRAPRLASDETGERMAAVRELALATLAQRATGKPIGVPSRTERLWLPRYFVRRSAWHALDHAWEIEDRSA